MPTDLGLYTLHCAEGATPDHLQTRCSYMMSLMPFSAATPLDSMMFKNASLRGFINWGAVAEGGAGMGLERIQRFLQ